MSDVDTAVDGAEAARLPDEKPEAPVVEQETEKQQESATADADTEHKDDTPRDEKGRFVPQERVNEITRARREAERRADALQRELEEVRQRPAQPQPQSHTEAPTLEQYNYDQNAWSQALIEYAVTSASTKAEQRLREQEVQRQRDQAATSFGEKARAYEAEHPGYTDRVQALDSAVQFAPEVIEAISLSDHGPALADYLATHLDEADRIARLPAHIAAVQIGRLEAQVSAPKPKPVTNAPNPVPTLSGGSSASGKDLSKLSYAAYKAEREKSL